MGLITDLEFMNEISDGVSKPVRGGSQTTQINLYDLIDKTGPGGHGCIACGLVGSDPGIFLEKPLQDFPSANGL